MMKKMKSSPWKRLAVVALIPAMGLFFWVSAKPNYVAQSAEMQAKANQSGNVLTTGEYTRDSVKISINDSGINNSGKQPLYVVDGKEVSHSQFNKIRRNTIESVSVLRDSSATNLYGEKGKNGAVLITTKKSKAIDLNTLPPEKRPLFIIDGKEVPYSQFKKIHPSTIDSMSVIKYKNATELYGEKGKNGVIIIVSKKK